jgi:hypothetical protein
MKGTSESNRHSWHPEFTPGISSIFLGKLLNIWNSVSFSETRVKNFTNKQVMSMTLKESIDSKHLVYKTQKIVTIMVTG